MFEYIIKDDDVIRTFVRGIFGEQSFLNLKSAGAGYRCITRYRFHTANNGPAFLGGFKEPAFGRPDFQQTLSAQRSDALDDVKRCFEILPTKGFGPSNALPGPGASFERYKSQCGQNRKPRRKRF